MCSVADTASQRRHLRIELKTMYLFGDERLSVGMPLTDVLSVRVGAHVCPVYLPQGIR